MFYKALYRLVQPLLRLFYTLVYFIKVYNNNSVPKTGGYIICGNHKNLHDGLIIAAYTKRRMNFIGKSELFKFKPFGKLLYGLGVRPVDRDGSDIAVVRTALKILKTGGGLVIFPEGTRHCNDINDSKDGAVVMAIKTKVPIIPVHIIGEFKLFSRLKVVYGKPYDLSQYYDKKLSQDEIHTITVDLMKTIYNIEVK